MTPSQLAQATGAELSAAQSWLKPITQAMSRYALNTSTRQAAFLAQIGEESGGLRELVEDLNYAAEALTRLWPTHFTDETAQQYGRTDEHAADEPAIADIAYANRMGNGDAASGDGWTYRGRGLIQLTGRAAYAACGKDLGLDLVGHPDLLAQPVNAALSAAWAWARMGCNQLADSGDFTRITLRINGGLTNIEARQALWARAKQALSEVPA
jgi:putative chitinase